MPPSILSTWIFGGLTGVLGATLFVHQDNVPLAIVTAGAMVSFALHLRPDPR